MPNGESERETMTKEKLWEAVNAANTQDELDTLANHAASIGYSANGRLMQRIKERLTEVPE